MLKKNTRPSGRKTNYEKPDPGEDDKQEASKVRATAARQCVRQIRQYTILSADWFNLVDSLEQLARLASLEAFMPNGGGQGVVKLADMAGRVDGAGTLWDQDKKEDAIRILVEEAKVNLCLRLLNEFKKWQIDTSQRREMMSRAQAEIGGTQESINLRLLTFEESLGMLLLRGFMHVETLQLTDLPLVIEHIVHVLLNADKMDAADMNVKLQETVVLYYFYCLMKHAEELNTAELLANTKSARLIHRVCVHVRQRKLLYGRDVMLTVAEGFAHLADIEDFQCSWKDFFSGDGGSMEDVDNFLEFNDAVVVPITVAEPERKKDLRPLMDLMTKLERFQREG